MKLAPANRARRPRRIVFVGVIVAAAVGFVAAPLASATGALLDPATIVPQRTGDVALTDANHPERKVTHGDSRTAFTVQIPADATCPGDSQHDQWRVQSFMAPSSDDVGQLAYGVIGPEGKDQHALFSADWAQRSFANVLLASNPTAGSPGVILPPPPFSFLVAAEDGISSGNYRIGLACTYFKATAKYWETEIVVTASPGNKLVWRLATAPKNAGVSQQGSSLLLMFSIAVAALGAVALGWFFRYRNRRTSRRTSPRTNPRNRRDPVSLSKESQ